MILPVLLPPTLLSTYHSLLLPLLEGAKIGEDLEGGAPLLELKLPVQHDRSRYNDEMRAPIALFTGQVRQEGNCLKI